MRCSCFSFWEIYIWFDYAFKSWALVCRSSWQPFTDTLCSEINKSTGASLTPEWREKDGNGLSQLPPEKCWMSLLKWEPKILTWSTWEKVSCLWMSLKIRSAICNFIVCWKGISIYILCCGTYDELSYFYESIFI